MSKGTNKKSPIALIPGFFKNDFFRKAIALFFAILFYFTVTSRLGIEEKVNNIPVQIDIPTSLINIDQSTPKVSLIIKGSKGILKQINRSSFKIRAGVQLSDYIAGEVYTLRLNNSDISCPLGVKVLRIEPRDLLLNLDRKVSKKVKVTAAFANKDALPAEYAVDEVTFQPSEVLVAGPESILEKIYDVKSRPIPLSSSVVDSFDYTAKLQQDPSISISPDQVNARVKIIRQNKTVTLKNIPINILEAPGRVGKFKVELLSSPHAAVTLSGLKSTIDLLKNDSVKPYVDVSAMDNPGTYSMGVSCWISSNDKITVKNIYPEKVQVKITRNR